MFKLGWCYEKGKGVSKSYDTARFWYNKLVKLGYKEAQEKLDNIKDK